MSQRTRNRRREHNLAPDDKSPLRTDIRGLEGRECRMYLCMDDGCGYRGWFPIDEMDER